MISNYELMIRSLGLSMDPYVEAARIKNVEAREKFDEYSKIRDMNLKTFILKSADLNEAQRSYIDILHHYLAKSGYFGRKNVDENTKPVSPFLDKFEKRYVAEGVYELMDESQPARLTPDQWVEHLNAQDVEKLGEELDQLEFVHATMTPKALEQLKESARRNVQKRIKDRNRDHLNSKLEPLEVKDAEIDEVDIQVLKALTDALVSLTRVLDNMAGTTLIPNPEII
jgi:hypothetical protein